MFSCSQTHWQDIRLLHVNFRLKAKSSCDSPLRKGDYPDIDTSNFLNADDTQQHPFLIGLLRWKVSLSSIEIDTAIMIILSFIVGPKTGNMDRIKRKYGYFYKHKCRATRFRTKEPDLLAIPDANCDWVETVCEGIEEVLPIDDLDPLGKRAVTII